MRVIEVSEKAHVYMWELAGKQGTRDEGMFRIFAVYCIWCLEDGVTGGGSVALEAPL